VSERRRVVRPLGGGWVGLWVCYDDRHHAKAVPTARWDGELKCWGVRVLFATETRRLADRRNGIDDGAHSAIAEQFELVRAVNVTTDQADRP
jgi:hypothetical protein